MDNKQQKQFGAITLASNERTFIFNFENETPVLELYGITLQLLNHFKQLVIEQEKRVVGDPNPEAPAESSESN